MRDHSDPVGRLPLAAILAGGASRRFGTPKPLEDLEGRPLLGWVRDALARGVAEPVVITNDPEPLRVFGLRSRPDAVQGAGPLGGVLAALLLAREEGRPGAVCVACDTPFLSPALLQRLVEVFVRSDADLVAPQSGGPLQVEPLCAVYHVRCIPELRRCLESGEHALGGLVARLRTERLPLQEVRRYGDPEVLFLNVNTREQHARAVRIARQLGTEMREAEIPPVVSIAGKKNSGKTTLTVAVAAELKRRGYRVASVKHGHHAFEIDQPGRDSWRHFHEGEVEAVLLVSSARLALVMRTPEAEPDPQALIRRFYAGAGYDLVLVEGYKYGAFPKVEIFRRAVHERPVYDPTDPASAARFLAIVTDDPSFSAAVPVIPLDADHPQGSHVARVADLIEQRVLRGEERGIPGDDHGT
jgi:molybdopterin-guanine dinucleotide biosynthesis protein MobB